MYHPLRFKLRTLFVLTTMVAVSACVYHLSTSRFRFDALLHISPRRVALSRLGNAGSVDYGAMQQDQFRIVQSREVLKLALEREHIATSSFVRRLKNPEQWLRDRLDVEFLNRSEIMRISIIGNKHRENPEVCAALLAAVAEEYVWRVNNQISGSVQILFIPTADK